MDEPREELTPAYEFEQPEPKPKRETNTRKHLRIKARGMKACIRKEGQQDDVVDVIDYSRGGLKFASYVPYEAGMEIEVATDYSPTAVVIFQKARVVGMYSRQWGNFPGEFGAQFLK